MAFSNSCHYSSFELESQPAMPSVPPKLNTHMKSMTRFKPKLPVRTLEMTRLPISGIVPTTAMMKCPTVLTAGHHLLHFLARSLPLVFKQPGRLPRCQLVSRLQKDLTSWTGLLIRLIPSARLNVMLSELRPYSNLSSSSCSRVR